jgi:hypothetical protein
MLTSRPTGDVLRIWRPLGSQRAESLLQAGVLKSMMDPGLGVAEQVGHGPREVAIYEVGKRHGF